MSKQVYEKIDFKIRYKMIYIIISFLSSMMAIIALKESKTTLGIESASITYVAEFSMIVIFIMLIATTIIIKSPINGIRIKEKYYIYIRSFANDCKENVTPAILINIPIAASFSLELTKHFNIQNLFITCFL